MYTSREAQQDFVSKLYVYLVSEMHRRLVGVVAREFFCTRHTHHHHFSLNNHFAYDRPSEKHIFELSAQMLHRFAKEAEVWDQEVEQQGDWVIQTHFLDLHSSWATWTRPRWCGWRVWRSIHRISSHGTNLACFACGWTTWPR